MDGETSVDRKGKCVMIDKIINLLTRQFALTMGSDEEFYEGYEIILSREQQFVKDKERKKGAIYIVVKFLPATLNFGQTVVPITITAVSEHNKLEVAQKLLLEFAQTYNLKTSDDGEIKQTYTSPSVLSNFNDIGYGFRSLMYMSGTFLISENSNPITKLRWSNGGEYEDIEILSYQDSFDIQLDSQAFSDSDNITRSVGKIGTFTMSFTTYMTETAFLNDINAVVMSDLKRMPKGVNSTFTFYIERRNGSKMAGVDFKLVNATNQQNIGELPVISLTFTK